MKKLLLSSAAVLGLAIASPALAQDDSALSLDIGGHYKGYASYVGVARSTTHVDISINKMSDNTNVDIGSMAIQISNK